MSIFKSVIFRFSFQINSIVKFSSVASNYNCLNFNPKFSDEEQQKILKTLNESSIDELKKFDVSQGRIKSLEIWKSKRGPFSSLNDILEVDGLGIKVLERLCNSIINENESTQIVKTKNKPKRQYVTPPINEMCCTNLVSAVGIYLGPSGMSWAKLNRDGNALSNWNYCDFSNYPKKLLPVDTFNLAVNILNKIPRSSIYVMETTASNGLQGQKQNTTTYNQHLELTSMLIALINSSTKHNSVIECINDETILYNNVIYFLKYKLPARLFSTLIGTERVSTISTISKVLENSENSNMTYTPINVDNELKNFYSALSPLYKELLGQSLMLIITFMDLCIYKNPNSLSAILPRR